MERCEEEQEWGQEGQGLDVDAQEGEQPEGDCHGPRNQWSTAQSAEAEVGTEIQQAFQVSMTNLPPGSKTRKE